MVVVLSGGVLLYLNPYGPASAAEIRKQYLPLASRSLSIARREEQQVEIAWQRNNTRFDSDAEAPHGQYCLVLLQKGKRLNKEELEGIRIWLIQRSYSIELLGFETVNFFGGESRVHTAYPILAETPTILLLKNERPGSMDSSWNVELEIGRCQTLATKDELVGLTLQPYIDIVKSAARSILLISGILALVFVVYWYQLRRGSHW